MNASTTHIGMIIEASGRVEHQSLETRRPEAGEMLVRPLLTGVCGTDIQIIRGQRSEKTSILGHEGVAEILEIGPEMSSVHDFTVGQRITFNPTNPSDPGDILGHSTPGLFQQYLTISRAALQRGMALPLDRKLPLLCAPLIEPLAVVLYGHTLVQQTCPHPRAIAVVGGGPIGLLFALYMRAQGCPTIYLIHNTRERLNWAVDRQIINVDETCLTSFDLASIMLDKTGGRGVDAVFLCTTRTSAVEMLGQALRFVREGGCIDLVGGFTDTDRLPEMPDLALNSIRRANVCGWPLPGVVIPVVTSEGKKVYLTGHRGVSEELLHAAVSILRLHAQRYATVISHILSFGAAPAVLETLRTTVRRQFQGHECVKLVIDCTDMTFRISLFDTRSTPV